MTRDYDERAKRAIKVIAGVFTILIRVAVMALLIFFIIRIAGSYIGALNDAAAPITRPRFGN